jgi:hypothetical protein
MAKPDDGVWRVEAALKAAVGARAKELMHRRSRHLAEMTPLELASMPGGDRIVLAEVDKIALQLKHSDS